MLKVTSSYRPLTCSLTAFTQNKLTQAEIFKREICTSWLHKCTERKDWREVTEFRGQSEAEHTHTQSVCASLAHSAQFGWNNVQSCLSIVFIWSRAVSKICFVFCLNFIIDQSAHHSLLITWKMLITISQSPKGDKLTRNHLFLFTEESESLCSQHDKTINADYFWES